MIRVIFQNLEKSELARNITLESVEELIAKFPDLEKSRISIFLAMDNSPHQAGPDLFRVRIQVLGGKYHGVILQKEGTSLYEALRKVGDGVLERLNRFGDRHRVKARRASRKLIKKVGAVRALA